MPRVPNSLLSEIKTAIGSEIFNSLVEEVYIGSEQDPIFSIRSLKKIANYVEDSIILHGLDSEYQLNAKGLFLDRCLADLSRIILAVPE